MVFTTYDPNNPAIDNLIGPDGFSAVIMTELTTAAQHKVVGAGYKMAPLPIAIPKTGDVVSVMLPLAVLAGALFVFLLLWARKRSSEQQEGGMQTSF